MKFLKRCISIGILASAIAISAYSVNAAESSENYPVTVWSADNMEIGNTTGINGLEFIQPTDTTAVPVKVTNDGRNAKEIKFNNTIKTGGGSSMLTETVPKTRAVKFTVTKPCNVIIYAYGASSNGTVIMKVSNSSKIIDTFATQHSVLNKYVSYLDEAGTYYIYGDATLGICQVSVGYVKGDVDFDFDLDWNDLRIARKHIYDNMQIDALVLKNMDIDNSGSITARDASCMASNIDEPAKAYFLDYAIWNANEMQIGYPETYQYLELVYEDNNPKNQSMCVKSTNKTFLGEDGEKKTYTKCIQTAGDSGNGIGNYPVTKAVKFNLSNSSYVTLYLSTGSSKTIQHKAQIINADGVNVAEFNIDKNISRYTVQLPQNETYFVTSNTGKLNIYEIDVLSSLNNSCSKTINVEAGKTYTVYLTVNNGKLIGKLPVKLTYNSAAITLESIGAGSKAAIGICNDRTVITEIGQGYIVFKPYDWKDNEGGIMTDVVFKASSSGTTELTLSMQEG